MELDHVTAFVLQIALEKTVLKVSYLTIRPAARKSYESIVHDAKPNGLLTRGLLGEGSNCFSINQLVGQKKQLLIVL